MSYRDNNKSHLDKSTPFYLRAFFILCIFSLICFALLFIYRLNSNFSEFFVRYISSPVRMCLGAVTSVFPFSLAESIFMLVLICAVPVCIFLKPTKKNIIIILMFSLVLFDLFAITVAPSYHRTPLYINLGIENRDITPKRLKNTCSIMVEMLNQCASDIYYGSDGKSYSTDNLSEMSQEILNCYRSLCQRYDFIFPVGFNAKPIALSVPLTYLHISGIYTFYTGEANINTNYPDYIIPHTIAHEMAHSRGIFNEGDANFVGFIACLESDNPYIRYSGIINIFPYVANALYSADPSAYGEVMHNMTYLVFEEMDSFSKFFEKYSSSKVAQISGSVNDALLKANGQEEGINSYGLVVDLTVNYLEEKYNESIGTEN
ncbi:MAG: DUF3810 domain-containing protein [Clostridia bacterium]|nr:DUF3810 domain-containing protein [Clostridia bacterium]